MEIHQKALVSNLQFTRKVEKLETCYKSPRLEGNGKSSCAARYDCAHGTPHQDMRCKYWREPEAQSERLWPRQSKEQNLQTMSVDFRMNGKPSHARKNEDLQIPLPSAIIGID